MEELFEKWKEVITKQLKEVIDKAKKGAWCKKVLHISGLEIYYTLYIDGSGAYCCRIV